jgi:predicted dinucleotide-binding enzyme
MPHVTIVGAGKMGKAIAGIALKGGSTVELFDVGAADSEVTGDIVVLAVPFTAVRSVIAQRGRSLVGRVVVDITNPVNFETFDSLMVEGDGSAAAHIAAALPQSMVLKAFNTTFAATLVDGTIGPLRTTVLIAGDHDDAKKVLAEITMAGGLNAIDVGSLTRARELEAVGFLQLSLAVRAKPHTITGFGIVI